MSKKLTLSRRHKIIAGVCGGLADYFNIDVVIIRAIFLVAFLGFGTGFLAYVVLWIVVPKEDFPIYSNGESYD